MWWWVVGCTNGGLTPRIEASGGGAGYWPPDSRTAVEGAIAAGFDGIELDVALTQDHVPVLVDGPWLEPDRCTGPDGPLLAPVLVRHRTAERLRSDFRCGGIPDPAHRDALVVSEPPMTLDELLDALHGAPSEMAVHLDIHQEEGLAPPVDVFARQILDRWFAEDLPQTLTVTSPDPVVLAAFDSHGRALGIDVPSLLVVPDPRQDTPPIADVLAAEAERWANGLDYVTKARDAGADGLSLRWDLADRTLVDAARDEGLVVEVWTVDAPDALHEWATPGRVDAVLTSYPGDVP